MKLFFIKSLSILLFSSYLISCENNGKLFKSSFLLLKSCESELEKFALNRDVEYEIVRFTRDVGAFRHFSGMVNIRSRVSSLYLKSVVDELFLNCYPLTSVSISKTEHLESILPYALIGKENYFISNKNDSWKFYYIK